MELTEKEIYDLNNRNVASQNVRLGDILATQSGDALTEKQMYDLTNDNVTTQKIEFGKIINAIATGNMEGINELTEEQQEALNNIDSAFQNVNLGNYVEEIIENQEPPTPITGAYLTFTSLDAFGITVSSGAYDGTLEYSTDKATWNTWDSSVTVDAVKNGSKYCLYFRGTGNTYMTGSGTNWNNFWKITKLSTEFLREFRCTGNIENLLDYQMVENGLHPPMADGCFAYMFSNDAWNALAELPELAATTLVPYCYASMFRYNQVITSLPNNYLPATTLAEHCYDNMFNYCPSLTTLPSNLLPATTLAEGCYNGMFSYCPALTTAPELPATTLAENCYSSMFQNCTNLETLPILPALNLIGSGSASYNSKGCYKSMFRNCSKIKLSEIQDSEYINEYRIPASGEGTNENSYSVYKMFDTTGGTFTGDPVVNTTYYTSNQVMPQPEPPIPATEAYLTFMNNSQDIPLTMTTFDDGDGSYGKMWDNIVEYSFDAETWNEWEGDEITAPNNVIYLRGTGNTVFFGGSDGWDVHRLTLTGENIDVIGNIETLLDYQTVVNGQHPNMGTRCFMTLFANQPIRTAPELPSVNLTEGCYASMFMGCTSLTTVPLLPATNFFPENCYEQMFYDCTSLYVSDAQTAEAQYEWKIPSTGVAEDGNRVQYDVFTNCLGTRSTDNLVLFDSETSTDLQNSYYTQNPPVGNN